MKKYLLTILAVLSVIISISCGKNAPAGPSSSATKTPTATITETDTITETHTVSPTPTNSGTATATATVTQTPKIEIDAFINGVNTTLSYWITVRINNSYYQYATITVNTDTLVYNGTNAYIPSGTTDPYSAGINYTVTIQTEYGTYTGTAFAPGGSIGVVSDVVNFTHDGNNDYLLIRDSTNALTYRSSDYYTDIDPGFTIPGSAYSSGAGTYSVAVYPESIYNSAFTGPTVPLLGKILIETTQIVSVIKP